MEGLQNGAVYFMVKPVGIDDVKNIWQFSVWWKSKINNSTLPREINSHSEEDLVRETALSSDDIINGKKIMLVVD